MTKNKRAGMGAGLKVATGLKGGKLSSNHNHVLR